MKFSKAILIKYSDNKYEDYISPDTYYTNDKGATTFLYMNGRLYTGPYDMSHGELAKENNLDYEGEPAGRVSSSGQEVALWDVNNNSYDDVQQETLLSLYNQGLINLNTKVFIHPDIQGLPLVNYLRNYNKQKEESQQESFSAYSKKLEK